jgi:hypothetical protein
MRVLSFRLVTEVRKKDTRIIPSPKAQKVEKPLYFAKSLCATRNNPALGIMPQIMETGLIAGSIVSPHCGFLAYPAE